MSATALAIIAKIDFEVIIKEALKNLNKKKLIIQSLVLEKPVLLLLIIILNRHPDQKLL